VSAYARNSKLAAYQSVSVHGGVAGGDPHRLVLMLMDGALERMAIARGCIERGEVAKKAQALHQCVNIVNELRGSLNLSQGGPLAQNLSELYDYMLRQLLRANVDSNSDFITEVASLMAEVRGAWVAIGPEVRQNNVPVAGGVKR
jgi:flagellar secretion chaperone FliS